MLIPCEPDASGVTVLNNGKLSSLQRNNSRRIVDDICSTYSCNYLLLTQYSIFGILCTLLMTASARAVFSVKKPFSLAAYTEFWLSSQCTNVRIDTITRGSSVACLEGALLLLGNTLLQRRGGR